MAPGDGLLATAPKAQTIQAETDKWSTQLEDFRMPKDTIQSERQPTEWENTRKSYLLPKKD